MLELLLTLVVGHPMAQAHAPPTQEGRWMEDYNYGLEEGGGPRTIINVLPPPSLVLLSCFPSSGGG